MTAGKPFTVLSLGWGVQSWTLAAMMALGELEPADVAIHADTTHERRGTYDHAARWTEWLIERGLDVRTVQPAHPDLVREEWSGSVMIPAFTTAANGKRGQVRRQCTGRWKIEPIRQEIRRVLGVGRRTPDPGSVVMIQGISYDEAHRMRTSDVKYIVNSYPLVDRKLTRKDCERWLVAHELPIPPKSACVFCPFHTISGWVELRRAGGADWRKAVAVDKAIRHKRVKARDVEVLELETAGPQLALGMGAERRSLESGSFELFVHPKRWPLDLSVRQVSEDYDAAQLAMELEAEEPCDSGVCWT